LDEAALALVLVLGIDTATWTASVGISSAGKRIAERSLPTAGSHGFSLLPLIEATLGDAGLETSSLQGIGVSIGPGSFTGLRIGLATAKGLAFAHRLPIAGVRTLPALAQAAVVEEGLVCPMLDARKAEVYTALVAMRGGRAEVVHAEVAVALERWLPLIGSRPCTFIGDAVELVRPHADPLWTLLPFADFHSDGGVIADLAWRRVSAGQSDDVDILEPFYARPSEAELKFSENSSNPMKSGSFHGN